MMICSTSIFILMTACALVFVRMIYLSVKAETSADVLSGEAPINSM